MLKGQASKASHCHFVFSQIAFSRLRVFTVALALSLLTSQACSVEEVLLERQRFLEQAFADAEPAEMHTLWLNGEIKEQVLQKIGYRIHSLRLRYWQKDSRTAWILDEIGKERPITVGIVVEDGRIMDVKILVYRESRGGEVRHNFFTRQFRQAVLVEQKNRFKLSETIDGITGATLSVRAVKKVAALALFLHGLTPQAIK